MTSDASPTVKTGTARRAPRRWRAGRGRRRTCRAACQRRARAQEPRARRCHGHSHLRQALAGPKGRRAGRGRSASRARPQARSPSAAAGIAVRKTTKRDSGRNGPDHARARIRIPRLLLSVVGASRHQGCAADRQHQTHNLELAQAISGGDAPHRGDDGPERADRSRDRERAELGRLVKADQPPAFPAPASAASAASWASSAAPPAAIR